MTTELKAGDAFPDFELPDHRDDLRRLVLRRTSYDRGAAARPARDHADPQRLPLRSVRHP
jgi:hypothetical protein